MKSHIKVNGQIFQTNKKWSHLKEKQRQWIYEITIEEHSAYVEKYGRLPRKSGKEAVLDKVHDRINEREIWIPWGEFKIHVGKFIDRRNRKSEASLTGGLASAPDNPASAMTGEPEDTSL